jgi:hypothetical protein
MSTTLLREIQQELSSRDVDVETVLRKCKFLARRLHSEPFAQWVERELTGYPADADVPPYRIVKPHSYASFSNGYQSVPECPVSPLLIEEKWRDMFERLPFPDGIGTAKALSQGDGAMIDRSALRFLLKGKIVNLPCVRFWSVIANGNEQDYHRRCESHP